MIIYIQRSFAFDLDGNEDPSRHDWQVEGIEGDWNGTDEELKKFLFTRYPKAISYKVDKTGKLPNPLDRFVIARQTNL